jgi:hypothetical protein
MLSVISATVGQLCRDITMTAVTDPRHFCVHILRKKQNLLGTWNKLFLEAPLASIPCLMVHVYLQKNWLLDDF